MPKKLTEENKQEILKLYRESGETTSTLADRYEVSSSTISRFLKSHLSEAEYEELIQQKRLARTPGSNSPIQLEVPLVEPSDEKLDAAQVEPSALEEIPVAVRIIPKPSAPKLKTKKQLQTEVSPTESLPQEPQLLAQEEVVVEEQVEQINQIAGSAPAPLPAIALQEFLGEEIGDFEEEDDEDDLEEDEEDLEDYDDEEWDESFKQSIYVKQGKNANLEILPLSQASLPKICYVAIDRAAELITRPLKEFSDLGQIPSEEFQQKTLPVFDNHRVAKRFCNRRERAIKIPDGRLLEKTCDYLQAKGITRLLLDGQVYSLKT
jgi:transposase-like protein